MRLYALPFLVVISGFAIWPAPLYREDATIRPTVLPHSEIVTHVRKLVEGTALVYVSGYFSFVGSDAQGNVTFAIDNNRGRDGENYQAEHFLVLHNEKQGLYLRGRANDDLYFHGSHSEFIQPLLGPVLGFSVLDGRQDPTADIQIEVTAQTMALGLFRWPTAWKVSWRGEKGPAVMVVKERERKSIVNWVFGGFAMSIVSGQLHYDGTQVDVYGFGETIR